MFGVAGKPYPRRSMRGQLRDARCSTSRRSVEGEGHRLHRDGRRHGAAVTPLSFVALLGGVGRACDSRGRTTTFSATYCAGEVGLRIHNLWLIGGVVRRDSVPSRAAARVRHAVRRHHGSRRRTGPPRPFADSSGDLINADISAMKWNDAGVLSAAVSNAQRDLFCAPSCSSAFPAAILASAALDRSRVPLAVRVSRRRSVRRASRRGIARSRRCSRSGSSMRPSRGSSGTSSASDTRRFRASSCRDRRTSTACGGILAN